MYSYLHNELQSLLQQSDVFRNANTTVDSYVIAAIDNKFKEVEMLRDELETLKTQHLDETLKLKEKLSHAIDQNYRLYQELGKE